MSPLTGFSYTFICCLNSSCTELSNKTGRTTLFTKLMANLTSSENCIQLQEKSDTLEKKLDLHSFKYKGMSVCISYLAADSSYSQTNSWRIYKTELKRTESGISTELCPPNLPILCDICNTDFTLHPHIYEGLTRYKDST